LGICAALAAGPARAQSQPVEATPTAQAAASSALLSPRPFGGATQMLGFEMPKYGNPPGFGAGRTGFDSTNMRGKPKKKSKRATKSGIAVEDMPVLDPRATATATSPPPPILYSQPNYVRSGAISPVYMTTGALLPAPPQPPRRRPPATTDPYEPLGIRAGAFLFYPAVELSAGYDNNVPRSQQRDGSSLYIVAPELKVRSDWVRHEVSADLRGTYSWYPELSAFNRPTFTGKVDGRIDVTAKTKIDLEGRYTLQSDTPGNPNNPSDVASPPQYATTGATAGVTHGFNRFELALKGTFDRTVYENATLNNGATFDLSDRNYDQWGSTLRGSYELTPGVKPFVEAGIDTRIHDLQFDFSGFQRDSDGVTARAGTTFELSRILTGEISAGYLTRRYADPRLNDLNGLIADASLTWVASALTKVKLTAKSTAEESTMTDVSGILKRDAGIEVEHSFRRWLVGSVKFSFGLDTYDGIAREDKRYTAGAALVYKLNPMAQLKGEVRQEWLRTNAVGSNYNDTIVLFGLRLQR
jgi:hypothetical protein